MNFVSLLLLLAACVHEFSWMLAPVGTRGAVRDVTQWVLICTMCWLLHCIVRHRFLSAVCAATGVMSSTTAACAAWWLVARFQIIAGQDGCSAQWEFPMMMLSAFAACAVFFFWSPHGKRS